jgi:hypothetical protein
VEVSADNIRLCRFDKTARIIENSFDGMNDQYLKYAIMHPEPVTKEEGLLVELKEDCQTFIPYYSSGMLQIPTY